MRLIIVGAGPELKRIREVASKHEVADCVIFAGQQSDLAPFYSIADIMVLPSHTEGSPNSLLEAMAAGLATVATAVGGVPEIVTTETTALLVEKQTPAALARAIARLLEDGDLRMKIGCAARAASSAYAPEAYCRSMLSMYQRVSGRGKDEITLGEAAEIFQPYDVATSISGRALK